MGGEDYEDVADEAAGADLVVIKFQSPWTVVRKEVSMHRMSEFSHLISGLLALADWLAG